MSQVISCTVNTTQKADTILNELKNAGFANKEISIIFPEKDDTKKWVQEKNTKAPEGAAAGVSTGGVLGGILGWLVGIGSLAIPGVGPFIAAGPIMAALSGSAIGAAVGGLTGTLVGLGIPEYEAKIYEVKLKEGLIFVSVHTQDTEAEKRKSAFQIFRNADASDISEIQDIA